MKLHGKNGSIHINGTPLTYATEWEFTVDREFVDVSVLGDLAAVFYAGLRAFSGSFSGLLDVGADAALNAAMEDVVTVDLYADSGDLVATGNAYVTATATASVTDAVRVSGQIKGTGKWTIQGV